jgi:hypothetical protein
MLYDFRTLMMDIVMTVRKVPVQAETFHEGPILDPGQSLLVVVEPSFFVGE